MLFSFLFFVHFVATTAKNLKQMLEEEKEKENGNTKLGPDFLRVLCA
jgi:hypothetical protein